MLKCQVIGNLSSDPEVKYSQDGKPILRFNVASNYRVKNGMGNWDDATEWVRVTVFGARAESLSQLLHKGQRVYCDGKLEARPWSARDGSPRAGLEMVASDVEFMSNRQDGEREPSVPAAHAPRGDARGPSAELEDLPF